jgi:hypothetical protein
MVRVVASSSKKNRSNLTILVVVAVCTMLGGSLIRIYLYEQEHSHSSQLLTQTTTHTTKHAILNEFKTTGRKTTKQQQQQHRPPQHQEKQKQQQLQQPEDEDDEEETEEREQKLTPESPVAAARLYPTLQCQEYGGPSESDAQEMVYWQGNNNIYIWTFRIVFVESWRGILSLQMVTYISFSIFLNFILVILACRFIFVVYRYSQ